MVFRQRSRAADEREDSPQCALGWKAFDNGCLSCSFAAGCVLRASIRVVHRCTSRRSASELERRLKISVSDSSLDGVSGPNALHFVEASVVDNFRRHVNVFGTRLLSAAATFDSVGRLPSIPLRGGYRRCCRSTASTLCLPNPRPRLRPLPTRALSAGQYQPHLCSGWRNQPVHRDEHDERVEVNVASNGIAAEFDSY